MTVIEPKLTVDDLALLPHNGNRYEVIEGELFVTPFLWLTDPHPLLTHQRILGRLFASFARYVAQHAVGEAIITPSIMFDAHNGATPDLIVITHERLAQIERDGRLHGAPELVIEILSPGTENRRRDEVIKRQTYGKFGVDEYWIVDDEQRVVNVFRLHNGALQPAGSFVEEESVTTPLLPGFALAVEQIFAR